MTGLAGPTCRPASPEWRRRHCGDCSSLSTCKPTDDLEQLHHRPRVPFAIREQVLAKKPVALLGVAGGRIGAIKSLEQLRAVCAHTGAVVIPGSVSVAGVRAAFNAEGACLDQDVETSLRGLATGLMDFVKDFVCPKYALEAMIRGETKPWIASL